MSKPDWKKAQDARMSPMAIAEGKAGDIASAARLGEMTPEEATKRIKKLMKRASDEMKQFKNDLTVCEHPNSEQNSMVAQVNPTYRIYHPQLGYFCGLVGGAAKQRWSLNPDHAIQYNTHTADSVIEQHLSTWWDISKEEVKDA